MTNHRSHRPAPERHARSQLAQLIGEQPFLRGSLVEGALGALDARRRDG